MRLLSKLVLFLAALAVGLGVLLYSGLYDMAADRPPGLFENWVLGTLKERAIARRADGITPPALGDASQVRSGCRLYEAQCSVCHGAPGRLPEDLALGLYPVPPALDIPRVQDRGDGQLYWIVKNGLKLTGMPAFGALNGDDELWSMVACLRRLPELSPVTYADLVGGPSPAELDSR